MLKYNKKLYVFEDVTVYKELLKQHAKARGSEIEELLSKSV